jgi:peptide/nickel transport system substrate-binding protein
VNRQKQRLPYLDEIVFLVTANEDAQVLRFQAGETDVISRFSAKNYSILSQGAQAGGYRLFDLGPSLEYNFLFFNLSELSGKNRPEIEQKQAWFRDLRFRQAVSAAIDRDGIIRLVYEGRATPLWTHVTPGNRLWINGAVSKPSQSFDRARNLLKEAGFTWKPDGTLVDARGRAVEFSILASASNAQRSQMATIIQDDLKKLGMKINVLPIEFRSLLDRVFNTLEYEAAVSGLVSGDADPTSEMNIWTLGGATHLWNMGGHRPAPWEQEIDRLMQQQLVVRKYDQRKKLYDRVQFLVAENVPLICLASPNVLVGAKEKVRNFQPAVLEPYVLWNAEELYLNPSGSGSRK